MTNFRPLPLWIVISAPSGAGKTTLCRRLLAGFPEMAYSVSCTTRAPREGEKDGVSYHFLAEAEFLRRVNAGEFLEYAQVHGAWYGTLKQELFGPAAAGRDVLMDLDVQGAESVRRWLRDAPAAERGAAALVDIFVAPPSAAELEARLRGRGLDDDAVIRRRLQKAEDEMRQWDRYGWLVVNDDLDAAYDRLRAIVVSERCRIRRERGGS